MADQKALAILKRGGPAWNAWRKTRGDPYVNLNGADLADAILTNADLTRAYLHRANLARANLSGAMLNEANLTFAHLYNANLTVANLTGANLREAWLKATIFADNDLSQCRGLDSCSHRGPSVLDHFTLLRSGRLPLPFLRGCGLPDGLIEYLPSLLNAFPIQFYSCFISFSTLNQDFADRLHADLQNSGVRCWFAPHDMQPGRKIHEQIEEAIRVYDRLLLILSKQSMGSTWVKTEIAKARRKEQELGRRVLFPIRLVSVEDVKAWEQFDSDIGDDSAKEIREYYLPDFSEWKTHDLYRPAFERLLAALKLATNATQT